ncbi:MAG: hypothetical protein ACD_79C01076G0001 [uncultured bacterium]|nr:MAG: hypothetical protein ACD_79C01076G0001 [uncultured bacterium]
MLKKQYFFIILTIIFCAFSFAESDHILIDDFSSYNPESFPDSWKMQNNKAKKYYKICSENDNKYLTIDSIDDSVNIGKELAWDIKTYPYLHWRWRVKVHPEKADQRNPDCHDCGAAIYVIIKNNFSFLPKYIKYVWSTCVPQDSRFFYKKNRAVVIKRCDENVSNEWKFEKANVYEDFLYFYKDAKPEIIGISILSDGNETHSESSADYDDIIISKHEDLPANDDRKNH